MSQYAAHPSGTLSFRRLIACCFLFVCAALPLHAWAIDTDGDGVDDSVDAFPNNPEATTDTDGDGKPDAINYAPLTVFADSFDTAFASGWVKVGAWSISKGQAYISGSASNVSLTKAVTIPAGKSGQVRFL